MKNKKGKQYDRKTCKSEKSFVMGSVFFLRRVIQHFAVAYINQCGGGIGMQWLIPHSKQVLGLIPGRCRGLLLSLGQCDFLWLL